MYQYLNCGLAIILENTFLVFFREFRAKSDVDNKRMTSLSVKIKEYEVMFNDTKINNRPTTVTGS